MSPRSRAGERVRCADPAQPFSFVEKSDANSYGSIDKLVLELAKANLSEGERALFRTTIESLQNTENKAAIGLFNSSSTQLNKANFQLGVAS